MDATTDQLGPVVDPANRVVRLAASVCVWDICRHIGLLSLCGRVGLAIVRRPCNHALNAASCSLASTSSALSPLLGRYTATSRLCTRAWRQAGSASGCTQPCRVHSYQTSIGGQREELTPNTLARNHALEPLGPKPAANMWSPELRPHASNSSTTSTSSVGASFLSRQRLARVQGSRRARL